VLDLHAHVLPGIDDGPADLDAAVAMARAAAADGVRVLAATPHLRRDFPAVVPAELAFRARELSEALSRAGVDLEIVQGGEADLYWAHDASDEDLAHASFGGRGTDLLVETPYGELPPVFEDLLFDLTLRGKRLLLAHPERSPTFRRDPNRLSALVERGVLLQVTASALAGPRRSRSRRFAHDLVREGRAHVIASDSHGAGLVRPPLSAGLAAAREVDPLRASWMVEDAPAAILAGDPLPPAPPTRSRRRAPWRRPL
jgi:protein-tyrosine phosphatase